MTHGVVTSGLRLVTLLNQGPCHYLTCFSHSSCGQQHGQRSYW